MNTDNCFAEVIASSLSGWVAQSWRWDEFPAFGSFVAIEEKERLLFGIVHQIQTGSMDPTRYPFPYKKTEEELLREQPHIFEFLKTTFSCVTVGYKNKRDSNIQYLLAPEPPKIHAFIMQPDNEIAKKFFTHMHYIHLLFTHSSIIFNFDECMLAVIQQQSKYALLTSEKLNNFVQTYALLIGNDYRRIKLFLQRIEQMLSSP